MGGTEAMADADRHPARDPVHVVGFTIPAEPPHPRIGFLVDGYLRLGDPRFRVVQLDLDGAVAQLATMADALAAYTADPVGHGPPGTGLPALRSAGIAVARDARAGELAKALDRSKSLDGQIPTSATVRIELLAEDLVRGYRPLVLQVGETVIGAPCRRRERHNLTGADPDHQFVDDEAHAWVSSGPTQSDRTPPESYMQEVLLRWEDWALSVPRPGKWIAPDATGHESPTEQRPCPDSRIALESRMSAIPGTQPRLRFGARYAVAVTVADLAGNEPPESRFGDPAVTADLTYLRYEPVSPPTVVLTQPIGPMTTPGEAVDRLVVRTDNRDPDSADTISNDRSERHLAPPSTSQAVAETHGKFDEFDDEDAYRLIVSRERAFPVSSGATDDPIVPPTQLVNGSLPLPYLPEPIATGITLTQLPGMYEGEIGEATDGGLDYRLPDVGERPPVPLIMIDTGNPASWADPKSVRIRLVPGDGKPSWDPKTRVLSINVPVGMTRTIRYSSRASSDIHLLAVYQLATDGSTGEQLARLERAADQGRHWMLTPYRELTLVHACVHACRRPVVLPVCENLTVRRSPGKTQGLVAGTVTFDLPSTGELMLEAVTEEWVDAGEDPDRFSLRSMPVGRYHVTPPSTTKKIDREFKLSLVPNPGARPPFVHEFGDTKYRRVRYRAIAISRYAEYFPSGTADLTRTSDIFNVDVPATTTPDPPRVRSVVPTLTWKTSDGVVGGNRVLTSTRRGNTVRVQLNRPWYSSGGGEQLAVVTEPSPFDGAAQLDSVVTRFGNDPIWRSRVAGELKPSGRYFPLATDTAKRVPLTAHGGTVVGFAAHDVRFDRDSDCWLADVELRSNGTENDVEYLPFVRLAFARYQKHALTGSGFDLRLSDVVMADPIQLLPTRTVQVTIKPSNPNLARVTVNGPVYWGRAGDSGGELTTSSVLTVEMQRRVDAIDDDVLGWEMVSTPITAEPVPSHPQVGPGMPVLWKGSITIPADGQFRVLVREFEEHAADSGNLATPVRTVRRLVYADAITLPT